MGNWIVKNLKYILECITEVVYPYEENCAICDNLTKNNELICGSCLNNIKFCYDFMILKKDMVEIKVYPLAYYSGIIMELILNLKYKSDFKSGEIIADLISQKIKKLNLKADYITFVPSRKEALKKRGYNQSEFLSKIISKNINVPLINCLCKTKQTKDQIGLTKDQRWQNVNNSFEILKEYKIKDKKIILIDDVITTGATIFNCAKELKKNKVKEIFVLTAAKSKV